MSNKRKRNVQVRFNLTAAELDELKTAVYLSGYTQQDYIFNSIFNKEIIVKPNSRVLKHLDVTIKELISNLQDFKHLSDVADSLIPRFEKLIESIPSSE